jgi:hypothetical protein
MHEGDNPSFWVEFIKFTFFFNVHANKGRGYGGRLNVLTTVLFYDNLSPEAPGF